MGARSIKFKNLNCFRFNLKKLNKYKLTKNIKFLSHKIYFNIRLKTINKETIKISKTF